MTNVISGIIKFNRILNFDKLKFNTEYVPAIKIPSVLEM